MPSLSSNLFHDLQRSVIEGEARGLIQRIDTTTSPEADDIVSFESAVRWLRGQGVTDKLTILECLRAAADEVSSQTNRTVGKSVTRTVYYRGWAHMMPLPLPPLQSITSVKYYDVSDTQQTVTASDYEVLAPTRGQGFVHFQADYSFPNLNTDRVAPIEIVAVSGYGDDATIPAKLKAAVRLLVVANHDMDPAMRDEARRMMTSEIFRGPS